MLNYTSNKMAIEVHVLHFYGLKQISEIHQIEILVSLSIELKNVMFPLPVPSFEKIW